MRQGLEFAYLDKSGVNRETISVRLPKAFLEELDSLAEETRYKKTELIQYAIDQLCRNMRK